MNINGFGASNASYTGMNTGNKGYKAAEEAKVKGRVFILSVMMKNERRAEDGFRSDR